MAHTHTYTCGVYTNHPHTQLGYFVLHSNSSCGNPWTLSHVRGRLGIPTTFLFWLAASRKREAVQSQFPHFVVEQHDMTKYVITQAMSRVAQTKRVKLSRHTVCLSSVNQKGETKRSKQGWRCTRVSPNVLTLGFIRIMVSFNEKWKIGITQLYPVITEVFNVKYL